MSINRKNLLLVAGVAALTPLLAAPLQAQLTTTIVDDSFADGDRANTGPQQAAFFSSSSGSSSIQASVGSLDLASGSAGRQFHALFDTQTLGLAGDSLTASVTFTTPATISTGGDDLRFAVLDNLGRTAPSQLAQDLSYSTGSPEPLFSGLFGYYSELDVESADPATDLDIRESDPSNTGRLLATTTGFTAVGSSGPDIGYTFAANTSYTLSLKVTRTLADELDITTEFLGESITRTDTTPQSFDFGMLGFGISSSAFGTSSTAGDADNGIDLTNVTVTFTTVPEPGSMVLGLMGVGLLAARRRRH